MLNWLRKQTAKLLRIDRHEQMAKNVDQCLLELAQIRQELNERLTDKCWSVDKIVIERLQADKVELNLDSINVRDLSGMLSIGFNYGGKLIKADSKGGGKTAQQPLERKTQEDKPVKKSLKMGMEMSKKASPKRGNFTSDKTPEPEETAANRKAPGKSPRLQIGFKG